MYLGMNISKKKVGGIFLLFFIVYYIITAINISTYSKKNETQIADVAIVLGAGIWNEAPSPIFKERINHRTCLNFYIF